MNTTANTITEYIQDGLWSMTGYDLDNLTEDLLSAGFGWEEVDLWIALNGETFLQYVTEEA